MSQDSLLSQRREQIRAKLTAGGVTFEDPCGSGAFGEVWFARKGDTPRRAVKICHFALEDDGPIAAYVRREWELLPHIQSLTQHPYIVTLLGFETVELKEEGIPRRFVVTWWEPVPSTLHKRRTTLERDVSRLMVCLGEIAEALDFMSARGFSHRDIKPANILYSDDDLHVRVADLGLSKQGLTLIGTATLEWADAYQDLGRNIPFPGTPGYAPPERNEQGRSDQTWDLYSFAVTCIWMLKGRTPWDLRPNGRTILESQQDGAFIHQTLEQLDFDSRQAKLLAQALDPDSSKRPARSVSAWFAEFRQAIKPPPPPPPPPERSPPLQHRRFRASRFTGREQDLDKLEREVRAHLRQGSAFGVWGIRDTAGIGKSALVAELAERLACETSAGNASKSFPGGVLWVDLLGVSPYDAARGWLRAYGREPEKWSDLDCLSEFHTLAAERRPLIVLDNVQDQQQIERLRVQSPGVAVLITTRDQRNLPPDVQARGLGELPAVAAVNLLRKFAPELIDADPDGAARVARQCDYFPLHLEAARGALTSGAYESATEFADDLTRRGLDALIDFDDRLAVLFEVQWERLTTEERQVFGVLSQFPGSDFGSNFVQAIRGVDEGTARRLLARLENASLLIKSELRYRFHDRVRDYAAKQHAAIATETEQDWKAVWTDWGFVQSELQAVGAFELSRQYHLLQQQGNVLDAFPMWYHFVRGQAHLLARNPELFFQQALNEPRNSVVSRAAKDHAVTAAPEHFVEWLNRQVEFQPPACEQMLEGHTDHVMSVALSADGWRAISGSQDQTVRVWNLATGKCEQTLEGHTATVSSVALSADGWRAISGSYDGTVRVWNRVTGEWEQTLEHTHSVSSVALSADGCCAISGSDNKVWVWNLTTGRCEALEGHENTVASVALSADGRRAISGSIDNTVRVWNLSTTTCEQKLEGHTGEIRSVAMSADGHRAISGSKDGTVRVWNLMTGQCVLTVHGYTHWLTNVVLSADGRFAILGGICLNLDTCQWEQRLETSEHNCFALSEDRRRAISISRNTIQVWNLATGQWLEGQELSLVESVAISADGRLAISGSFDNMVRVWNLTTGRCEHTLEGHNNLVHRVALSADGIRAISGSWDLTVRVWNLVTGKCEQILEGHDDFVTSVALSADGRFAIFGFGSDEKAIRVWNLATGKCERMLQGHTGEVASVALSADGRWVMSESDDGKAQIWNLDTEQRDPTYPCQSRKDLAQFVANRFVVIASEGGVALHKSGQSDRTAYFPGSYTCAATNNDGRFIIVGTLGVCLLRHWTRVEFLSESSDSRR